MLVAEHLVRLGLQNLLLLLLHCHCSRGIVLSSSRRLAILLAGNVYSRFLLLEYTFYDVGVIGALKIFISRFNYHWTVLSTKIPSQLLLRIHTLLLLADKVVGVALG